MFKPLIAVKDEHWRRFSENVISLMQDVYSLNILNALQGVVIYMLDDADYAMQLVREHEKNGEVVEALSTCIYSAHSLCWEVSTGSYDHRFKVIALCLNPDSTGIDSLIAFAHEFAHHIYYSNLTSVFRPIRNSIEADIPNIGMFLTTIARVTRSIDSLNRFPIANLYETIYSCYTNFIDEFFAEYIARNYFAKLYTEPLLTAREVFESHHPIVEDIYGLLREALGTYIELCRRMKIKGCGENAKKIWKGFSSDLPNTKRVIHNIFTKHIVKFPRDVAHKYQAIYTT
jgi:hypothetical protein